MPPRADRLLPTPGVEGLGEPQPLGAYLDRLGELRFDDIDPAVAQGETWAPWRTATAEILDDQVAFALSVLDRSPAGVVALLRDALPYHLFARRHGVPSAAVPLGRSYLHRFAPGYSLYDFATGALYDAVRAVPDDPEAMWTTATADLRRRLAADPAGVELVETLRREALPVLPAGDLVVLETGLQGTMPLLFAAVFPEATQWAMYAAGPWLADAFGDHVFQKRYAALRPAETLTCTDRLFQVSFHDGAWWAREALDPATRACAYWEIATLNTRA